MHTPWRCYACGPVLPLHAAEHISAEIVASVGSRVRAANGEDGLMPVWCPWPLPLGWTVTGIAWAGDDRGAPKATAVALSGPTPLIDGPADAVFVAEEPGVGLGNGLAGFAGPDPGPDFPALVASSAAPVKVKVAGHPTPLWPVAAGADRSVYIGEARGMWLFAITWPAAAGYLLAETIALRDLAQSVPTELPFGAPSGRLRPTSGQR
jgi:hypothetical protein